MNSFMGKEWENKQLEKLKAKQEERIAALQKQVDADLLVASPEKKTTLRTHTTPNKLQANDHNDSGSRHQQ